MDEMYFAESFKGNHVKSSFEMSHPSRKREKEVTKRRLRSNQACVLTGIERQREYLYRTCMLRRYEKL